MGQWSNVGICRIDLGSPRSKLLVAVVCALLIGAYLRFIVNVYRAEAFANNEHDFRKALQVQPRNSEYHYRVALQHLYQDEDAPAAAGELRAAVALNPTAAPYWLALATAMQVQGDNDGEQHALESALRWDPTTPNVAWRAALFYVIRGDPAKALPLFRVVVANDPDSVAPALSTAWHVTHDADMVIDKVLPDKPESYLAFIDVLCGSDDTAAAQHVWNRLVERKLQPDPRTTFHYLWYLYQHHEAEQARRVWRDLANINPEFSAYVVAGDMITNGGFEKDTLEGGFDWHFSRVPGVHVALDSSVFHAGIRSLGLRYDIGSVGPAGIEQVIPVEPRTTYQLSAFVRADELISASGPRLLLSDAFTGQQYALSDPFTGTSAWQQWRQKFTTAPDATFLVLTIVRSPAEPLIQGSFWVDDVSMVRQ